MKIEEWLKKHDRTPAWLARQIGKTPEALRNYIPSKAEKSNKKIINPPKSIVLLLQFVTNGEITLKAYGYEEKK